MFLAGMTVDLKEFARIGKSLGLVSFFNVSIAFMAGYLIGLLFHQSVIVSLFLGAALTATSVSISVRTLMDLKKLESKIGTTIIDLASSLSWQSNTRRHPF